MNYPKCEACGKTAFSHNITTGTQKRSYGKTITTYSAYCSVASQGRCTLSTEDLQAASVAVSSFVQVPSNYKPPKAIKVLGLNDSKIPPAAKAKTKTIYLADGRYFETKAAAEAVGGLVMKASTSWAAA
jgi:hypothetical protein